MKPTIAVIAKECLPGRVKTRLTPPLTPGQAAVLAQVSLAQTLEVVRSLPAMRRILYFQGTASTIDAEGFELVSQADGELDQRLAALCDLTPRNLLILGMDTPHVDARAIGPLLQDWDSARPGFEAWLGPATDGGFWALGLRRPAGELLRGVPMSTPDTGREQALRLSAAGLRVGLLPRLTDVDHFTEAIAVARCCPGTPFAREVHHLLNLLAMPSPDGLATPTSTSTDALP